MKFYIKKFDHFIDMTGYKIKWFSNYNDWIYDSKSIL